MNYDNNDMININFIHTDSSSNESPLYSQSTILSRESEWTTRRNE
jgi:hypothetical protein